MLAPVAGALAVLVYMTLPDGSGGRGGRARALPGSPADRGDALRVLPLAPRRTDDVFRAAPNGVTFDTPESVRLRAETIRQRVVQLKNMPLANKTGMTETERDMLGRWIDQGARVD